MAPLSATPSMVSTRQPSACAASIRQPGTGRAVPEAGRCADRAVLAADVGAGEPELVAQEVDQVLPALDLAGDRRAVDGAIDLHAPAPARRVTTRVRSTRARWRRSAGDP